MGIVLLFVGTIFLLIGGRTALQERRYRQQSVQVEGVATGKTLRHATLTSSTSYEISYRFTRADGRTHTQTESVPVHLWERIERESPLAVEYFPDRPESARAVRDTSGEQATAIGALGIGGILVLIALGMFTAAGRRRGHQPGPHDLGTPSLEPAASISTVMISPQTSFWPLARRSSGFWFGGFFLVVSLPFVLAGLFLVFTDWQFAREARPTQGMVLTKDIRTSGRKSRTKHYEATYRFTAGGAEVEGRDELPRETWERLREREPVGVRYLPQRPSSSHLSDYSPGFRNALVGLLGAVFAVVGGRILMRSIRHARLEWHLRQHGLSTNGTVIELVDRHLKVNGIRQWRLHYEYRDTQGHRHVGTADLGDDEVQQWKVGDTGSVLFDSQRPAQAVWYGREGAAW